MLVLNGHYETEGILFDALAELTDTLGLREVVLTALSWWCLFDGPSIERLVAQDHNAFVGWHAEHVSFT